MIEVTLGQAVHLKIMMPRFQTMASLFPFKYPQQHRAIQKL
jgi:hypothetical protein